MTGYGLVNLKDMIQELGEGRTKEILSEFSCPLNKDVEFFLHCKAIEFARQGIAQTQLLNPRRCGTVTCPAPFFIPHYTAEVLRFFHSLLTVRAHRFFNSPFFHGREGLPSFSGQAKTSSLFIVLAGIRSCKSIIRSVSGFVHEKNVKSCKRNRKTKN